MVSEVSEVAMYFFLPHAGHEVNSEGIRESGHTLCMYSMTSVWYENKIAAQSNFSRLGFKSAIVAFSLPDSQYIIAWNSAPLL